MLFFESY